MTERHQEIMIEMKELVNKINDCSSELATLGYETVFDSHNYMTVGRVPTNALKVMVRFETKI